MNKSRKGLFVKNVTYHRFQRLKPSKKTQEEFICELLDFYEKRGLSGQASSDMANHSGLTSGELTSQPSPTPISEKLANPPSCNYRAIDVQKGIWFCDVRPINKFACLKRQERFLYNERQCRPAHMPKQRPLQVKTRKFRDDTDSIGDASPSWSPDKRPRPDIQRCQRGHVQPHGLDCEACSTYPYCTFPEKVKMP